MTKLCSPPGTSQIRICGQLCETKARATAEGPVQVGGTAGAAEAAAVAVQGLGAEGGWPPAVGSRLGPSSAKWGNNQVYNIVCFVIKCCPRMKFWLCHYRRLRGAIKGFGSSSKKSYLTVL